MFLLLLSNLYESKIHSAWKSVRYSRLNIHITSGPAPLLHLHLLQLIHGFSHYFSTSVVTRPPPAPGDQTWGPPPITTTQTTPPGQHHPLPGQHYSPPPETAPPHPLLANRRAVRILLECVLVTFYFKFNTDLGK